MAKQITVGALPDIPVDYDATVFRKAFNILQTFMSARSKSKYVVQVSDVASAEYDAETDVFISHYDGVAEVTIPSAVLMVGRVIVIKNACDHVGTHSLTILPSASDTIDYDTSEVITTKLGCRQLYSDGENWHIIGSV